MVVEMVVQALRDGRWCLHKTDETEDRTLLIPGGKLGESTLSPNLEGITD